MVMRTQLLPLMLVTLLGSTNAVADSMSLNQFPHRVEPVLGQVDAAGKVTRASPAYTLPPKMTRLLRDNLSEMIRKPATDKHGKPTSSQFIMNMALQAKPVPPGSWYWVHLDGDRLALASPDMFQRSRRPSVPVQHYYDGYRPTYRGASQPVPAIAPAPAPTMRNTPGSSLPPRAR